MHAIDDLARADRSIRSRCHLPGGSFTEFPRGDAEGSIGDRFAAQVRRFPDRLAVRTPDARLTYADLDHAAARVAAALRRPAAGPVALVLDSAEAFVVASLGAAVAGAIQVPLDRAFPPPRLIHVLEQSGARTILASERHAGFAREIGGPGCAVLVMESLAAHAGDDGPAAGDPGAVPRPGPDTIAAIEYTSGSTGQPKGIVRSHRGVLHDVLRHTNMSRLCPEDRLMLPGRGAVHAFHALLNGAAFLPAERHHDAIAGLADWLAAERVTVLRCAVSYFRAFAGALTGAERFPHLRLIELYGEPVYERDVDLYRKHFSTDCLLVSTLGTSEFGDFAHHFVDRGSALPGGVVPAGYPAQDVEVLLLDEDGRPTREDAGEIALRSRYGAVGYWQMPELTAALFGPAEADGRRVYRTGDVGRIGADGGLHHLGRRDFQVKINGNRVHVSEVEAALLDHEAVRAAAVLGREEAPGQTRLVAYVVPAGPTPPGVSALRRTVAARLPAFMVPSAFVVLDALPKTATGKVDRRALPAPDRARPALETPYAAPGTPLEERLAALWAEVLHVDEVGVDDSFFELGGNSLLATALATGVVESFSLSLPLRTLLESGTVRAMAGAILAALAARADAERLAAALDALGLPPEAETPSARAEQPLEPAEIAQEPQPSRAPEAAT
jgi:acyl-coenzyme A synthetase/AMP-(fatty) acid ligase